MISNKEAKGKTLHSVVYGIKNGTINRTRVKKNYENFMQALQDVQVLLPDTKQLDPKVFLEVR